MSNIWFTSDTHFRPVSLKEVALKLARLPEHKDVRRRRDEGEGS